MSIASPISRQRRIIHLIDSLQPINYGVWGAAISTAAYLAEKGWTTEVWYPRLEEPPPSTAHVHFEPLSQTDGRTFRALCERRQLDTDVCIIHSHGSWSYATKWGARLAKRGFSWIYCPQGMLEPWSLAQKALKKSIYYRLFEQPQARRASAIRAVSLPEQRNLQRLFTNGPPIRLIPNGVDHFHLNTKKQATRPQQLLFLGRLHVKKGVTPLVAAWLQSKLARSSDFELHLIGPDQGELAQIQQLLRRHPSLSMRVHLRGPLYGAEKLAALRQGSYIALPSFSEGFPSTVIEGVSQGLLPLISEGCNFPELLEAGHGLRIGTTAASIVPALDRLATFTAEELSAAQRAAFDFVRLRYALPVIADQQDILYHELLSPTSTTTGE